MRTPATRTEGADDRAGSPPTPPAELLPATVVGRYILLYRVGRGGMGEVWAAHDTKVSRKVALKILRSDLSASELLRRVGDECRAMAKLSHRNVVTVFDYGEAEGQCFVAMEFFDGMTLRDRLLTSVRMPFSEIVTLFRQAGEGLWAIHRAGLVHGDFKPSNVLVSHDGRVAVCDLGLAVGLKDNGSTRPAPHARGGTPAYMAPEVKSGRPANAQADQFSFALALRNSLTQRVTANRARVPSYVSSALRRACQPDPRDRFPSMTELLVAIDPRRRHRAVVAGRLVIAMVLALSVGFFLASIRPDDCRPPLERVEEVWNPTRKKAIEQALVKAHPRLGADIFARISPALDSFGERWLKAHRDTCQATFVRREQSPVLLDLRMACLGRQVEEFSSLIGYLETADAPAVLKAAELVDGVGKPTACQRSTLQDSRAAERPRDKLEPISTLEAVLDKIEIRLKLGDSVAPALLERMLTESESLGFEPVMTRAHLIVGRVYQQQVLSYDKAAKSFERALWLAIANRDRDDELSAYAYLIETAVLGKEGLEGARRWLPFAEATYRAVSDDETAFIFPLLSAMGTFAWFNGDFAAAYEYTSELVRKEINLLGPDHLLVAKHTANLALFAMDLPEQALKAPQLLERSLAIRTERQGPEHPALAEPLRHLADYHCHEGKYRQCLELIQQSEALIVEEFGTQNRSLTIPRLTKTHALIAMDRPTEAATVLRETIPRVLETYGEDNILYAVSLELSAEIHLLEDRPLESLADFRLASEVRGRIMPEDHPGNSFAQLGAARALSDLGREAELQQSVQRAREFAHESPVNNKETGLFLLMSARRHMTGGAADQALEAVDELARLDFAQTDPHLMAEARMIEAQLALELDPEKAFRAACEASKLLESVGSKRSARLAKTVGAMLSEMSTGTYDCTTGGS